MWGSNLKDGSPLLIREEHNFEMPHDLSSTMVPHHNHEFESAFNPYIIFHK